ncbi:TVP38/TMEM64 family protein [Amycolatopsis rubida]|uniref:TVP38/TMEM64 family membrane protein n=1 Tax=Amycolatopsis rubida TaxID=112413 RepID=A0ABX0C9C5_9PSEU|nr:TVP38/TMEM64 family protein [Amycolatopsis sp. M39]MYW96588.1 TVP38/TMEM64 family protein [Amycolatopsis rubida]NEC61573.1 TVP38/TMEM64 family protein [Amycolatopsis rubida]OAP26588.1 TVP38/TMEM64 family inner membrane protein YdjZ [Amycolatopsis sp. M39]
MSGRTKLIAALAVLALLGAAALWLPIPGPAQLRTWAAATGSMTPLVLLVAYSLLTVAPIPRTVFNLAAGLLVGSVAGVVIALAATTIAAGLAYGLARLLGRDLILRHLHRAPVRAVNDRLSDGGVLAITSLRLIPVVPFSAMNYLCGVSSVKLVPYLAGTALGSVPGTVAVVVFADGLTGDTPPALLACYAVFAALGAAGLVRVLRKRVPAAEPEAPVPSAPAG